MTTGGKRGGRGFARAEGQDGEAGWFEHFFKSFLFDFKILRIFFFVREKSFQGLDLTFFTTILC